MFNFKVEIELRMPESVVEIEVMNKEEGVFFHKFFWCLKPSIDGFLRPHSAYPENGTIQLVFLAGTVFFSRNNSARTAFSATFSHNSASQTGHYE